MSGYDEAVEAGQGGGQGGVHPRSFRERLTGLINLPGRLEQGTRLEPAQKTVESRELATNPLHSPVVQDSVQQTVAQSSPVLLEETAQSDTHGGAVHVEVHNLAEEDHNHAIEVERLSTLLHGTPPPSSSQQTINDQ